MPRAIEDFTDEQIRFYSHDLIRRGPVVHLEREAGDVWALDPDANLLTVCYQEMLNAEFYTLALVAKLREIILACEAVAKGKPPKATIWTVEDADLGEDCRWPAATVAAEIQSQVEHLKRDMETRKMTRGLLRFAEKAHLGTDGD